MMVSQQGSTAALLPHHQTKEIPATMATLTATNFTAASNMLGSGPKVRRIGNNTTIEVNHLDDENVILVRLHGHAIVALHADGSVSVRDCGYVTTTTYDRINAFLPWGWYATRRGGSGRLVNRNDATRTDDIASTVWTRVSE